MSDSNKKSRIYTGVMQAHKKCTMEMKKEKRWLCKLRKKGLYIIWCSYVYAENNFNELWATQCFFLAPQLLRVFLAPKIFT